MAATTAPEDIRKAVDEYLEIGAFIDGGLQQQTQLDLDNFERATGRRLTVEEDLPRLGDHAPALPGHGRQARARPAREARGRGPRVLLGYVPAGLAPRSTGPAGTVVSVRGGRRSREQYLPGPANLAHVKKDGEKWTLVLVAELRHAPEKVCQAITDPAHLRE
jgi:hypothetical protein